jgi:hypothetical protein
MSNMIVDHGEWPLDLADPAPSRAERIEKIIQALRGEMDSPNVHPGPIREFLMSLNEHTAQEWRHLFVTTNWDYLLQRELNKMVHTLALPAWLHLGAGSHVYHLNGTVEAGTQHRSCFMLQDDKGPERTQTTEANYAFGHMICERTFVVVGMSFECGADKFLLTQLKKVEDCMPIGESNWIIVNPHGETLETVCGLIRQALPAAHVESVKSKFADWRHTECPTLKTKGVFRN